MTMRGPIRVALFATCIDFGGIERVLLSQLQSTGKEVEYFPFLFTRTDTRDRSFFETVESMGVPHETFFVNTNTLLYLNPVRNLAEVAAIMRAKRFDLIHSHGYRADMLAVVLAALFRLPLVSTCHGFISNDSRLRLYNWIDVALLRRFTRVVAVSSQMKEHLVAKGVREGRIDVIPNVVDVVPSGVRELYRDEIRSRLGIRKGEFVFGFVGRLSLEKGVDWLIRAMATVVRRHPLSRLLIVGEGPERSGLEREAIELGLERHVSFVGFQREISPWYSAMDAFALPSLTEGTPVALLEAMAHGLPVIASAVGGVPSVVSHDSEGLLVSPANADALAAAMLAIAQDDECRNRFSEAASRAVRRSGGLESWAAKLGRVYTAALGQACSC